MTMLLPKTKIIRDKGHLKFVASLPCCISLHSEVQAAHVKDGWFCMGKKIGDDSTVPLYWKLHQEQHRMKESDFWLEYGHEMPEVKELAHALYAISGNWNEGIRLISVFRYAVRERGYANP